MLAIYAVLIDGASGALVKQAEAAGAKTLMMTGSPDRIVELDGAGPDSMPIHRSWRDLSCLRRASAVFSFNDEDAARAGHDPNRGPIA